jgi:hypothetical protein
MFGTVSAVLPGYLPISGVYNIKMCQDAPQQIFAALCAPKAAPMSLPRMSAESVERLCVGDPSDIRVVLSDSARIRGPTRRNGRPG